MTKKKSRGQPPSKPQQENSPTRDDNSDSSPPREWGGPRGKEPTRYGDWEKNGRCIDF